MYELFILIQLPQLTHNKLPSHIAHFILRSSIESEGLEKSKTISKKIRTFSGRYVSERTIRRYGTFFLLLDQKHVFTSG